ncbi:hypothetical protein ACFSGI_00975 [Paenibacillus nicotianae]|uniref:Uncharacterized protein n=1 Tax=Paenibacillus nicotianae TaxID=1526551 RepID=A0ABW4UQT3_9BACL
MRNQNVLNEQWMQKRNGVKTFFHKLSVDPSLKQEKEGNKDFDVNEWLEMATSPLPEEISHQYGIYEDKMYRPLQTNTHHGVNVAVLVDLLFKKSGLKSSADDLVKHMNNGGTLEGFITKQDI